MAGHAANGSTRLQQREALDALAIKEAQFSKQRQRSIELAQHPEQRERWETADVSQAWLDRDADDLLEAYLSAGRAESGAEFLEGIPPGLVNVSQGRRIQLFAAAGRMDEARALLRDAAASTDEYSLKFQAAIALAEHQPEQARSALERIGFLQSQRPNQEQSTDPYLELLRWIATRNRSDESEPMSISEAWPGPIQAFVTGKISERDLVLAVHRRDGGVDRERLCEALFYKGLLLAADGKSRSARAHWRAVVDLHVEQFFEHAVAAVLVK